MNAPITDWDGVTRLGPGFAADLYWHSSILDSPFNPLHEPATFSTNGYFIDGVRTIPFQGAFATIYAQVRVWDLADGLSFESAAASGSPTVRLGYSPVFQVALTSPLETPAPLTGLSAFSVNAIPLAPLPRLRVTIGSSGTNILLFSWPAYYKA